jgi:SAM-dependent methyltransferase
MTNEEFRQSLEINLPYAYVVRSFLGSAIKKHNIPLDNVMDIGSGTGFFINSIISKAQNIIGMDLNSELIDKCNEWYSLGNVKFINADFLTYRFERQFSFIFSFMVFEHIEHDDEALKKVSDILAPGGYFVMCVPGGPHRFGNSDIAAGHFRRYTKQGLISKIESAGLTVLDKYTFQPKIFNALQNTIGVRKSGEDKIEMSKVSSYTLKPRWYIILFSFLKLWIPLLLTYSYLTKKTEWNGELFVVAQKRNG